MVFKNIILKYFLYILIEILYPSPCTLHIGPYHWKQLFNNISVHTTIGGFHVFNSISLMVFEKDHFETFS